MEKVYLNLVETITLQTEVLSKLIFFVVLLCMKDKFNESHRSRIHYYYLHMLKLENDFHFHSFLILNLEMKIFPQSI